MPIVRSTFEVAKNNESIGRARALNVSGAFVTMSLAEDGFVTINLSGYDAASAPAAEAYAYASGAYHTASQALSTATIALESASTAGTQSADALANSIDAVNVANAASTTSLGIDDKATRALSSASFAVEIANQALTASTNVEGLANQALSASSDANTSASIAFHSATLAFNASVTASEQAVYASSSVQAALNSSSIALVTSTLAYDSSVASSASAYSASLTASQAASAANSAVETANLAQTQADAAFASAQDALESSDLAFDMSTDALATASLAQTDAAEALATASDAFATASQTSASLNSKANTNLQNVLDNSIALRLIPDSLITGTKLSAGAIGAREIAANSITAAKLLITDFENLVENSGFENGFTGWVGGGTAYTIDTASFYSGKQAVKTTAQGSVVDLITEKWFEVSPGDQLYGEFWVSTSADNNGDKRFLFHCGDANKQNLSWPMIGQFTGTTAGWVKKSGSITVPAGKYFVRFGPSVRADSTTGSVWWDNIYVRRMQNGQVIVDGTITTAKLSASSITGEKIVGGTIQGTHISGATLQGTHLKGETISGTHIAANTLTADKIALGVGLNLVNNADWSAAGTGSAGSSGHVALGASATQVFPGWIAYRVTGSVPTFAAYAGLNYTADWSLAGITDLQVAAASYAVTPYLYIPDVSAYNNPTPYAEMQSDRIPVKVGSSYIGSVYTGAHRGTVSILIGWYDSGSMWISSSSDTVNGRNVQGSGFSGGKSLTGYKRIWVKATPPANAAFARLAVQLVPDNPNNGSSYAFILRSMLEESSGAAPGAWVPGIGTFIDGSGIKTNTLHANRIIAGTIQGQHISGSTIDGTHIRAATISGTQIAGETISGSNIVAGTISAKQLNVINFENLALNPSFAEGAAQWTFENGSAQGGPGRNGVAGYALLTTVAGGYALRSLNHIPCTEGETFYAHAFFSGSGTGGGGAYIRLRGLSAAGGEIWTTSGTPIRPTTWTSQSVTGTIPANVVKVNVEIVASNISGNPICLDDVYFRRTMDARLIVDGAITAAKITASAISSSHIQAGAIETQHISASSIVGSLIQAGAIGAREIAAQSITARNLTITNFNNIWPNPNGEAAPPSGWAGSVTDPEFGRLIAPTLPTGSEYKAGSLVRKLDGTSGEQSVSLTISVQPSSSYHFSAMMRNLTGAGNARVYHNVKNADGVIIQEGHVGPNVTAGVWTRSTATITIPDAAQTLTVYPYANTGAVSEVDGIVLQKMTDGQLIVDGAITAAKIFGSTITGDKIVGGTISGTHLAAQTVSGTHIAATTLNSSHIAAGAIVANRLTVTNWENLYPNPNIALTSPPAGADNSTAEWWGITSVGAGIGYNNNTHTRQIVTDGVNSYQSSAGCTVTCSPGESFYAECYARRTGSAGVTPSGGFNIILRFYNKARTGGWLSQSYMTLNVGDPTQWSRLSCSGIAPSGCHYVDLTVETSQVPAAVGTIFMSDAFVFKKMADANLIVDGAVTATKISASAVQASHITASAIRASHISASSILASHLTLQPENLIPNGYGRMGPGSSFPAGAWEAAALNSWGSPIPTTGQTYFKGFVATTNWLQVIWLTDYIPCSPGEQFRLSATLYTSGTFSYVTDRIVVQYFNGSNVIVKTDTFTLLDVNDDGEGLPFDWTGVWAEVVTASIAPATAQSVRVRIEHENENFGQGSPSTPVGAAKFAYTPISLTRMVGASLIVSGAISASHIAARSISAQHLTVDALQTSNYVEGLRSVDGVNTMIALSGAKLDSTGTALKVAADNLLVGDIKMTRPFFRAVNALHGSPTWSKPFSVYRGNCDMTGTNGGVPNVSRFAISVRQFARVTGLTVVVYTIEFSPNSSSWQTDNLDAMRFASVEIIPTNRTTYATGTSSSRYYHDVCLPDRSYYKREVAPPYLIAPDHTDNRVWTSFTAIVPGTYGVLSTETSITEHLYLNVGFYNAFGQSQRMWYYPPSALATAMVVSSTLPSGGGGSTWEPPPPGDDDRCPAPWEPILLADGREVAARDLRPGMEVLTHHESTGAPGIYKITSVRPGFGQRWFLELTDGRRLVATHNHRFAVVQKGWIPLDRLNPGDHIDGESPGIVARTGYLDGGEVIQITVAEAHTYIQRGLLAHNVKIL